MKEKKTQTKKSGKGGQKDGVSFANILSVLGVVLLGFFLYLGFAYKGVNSGTAVLYAALISTGFALLLAALVTVKKVENNFQKWRWVEYGLLGVFIAGAVAVIPTMCYFININSHSDELKEVARTDIDNIRNTIALFKLNESKALTTCRTDINTKFVNGKFTMPSDLQEIFEDIYTTNDTINNQGVKKWEGYIEDIKNLNDTRYYGNKWTQQINENRQKINSWSIFSIPQAIEDIDRLSKEIPDSLMSISASYKPIHTTIDVIGNLCYKGSEMRMLFRCASTTSRLKEQAQKYDGITPMGVILSLVIFLLIIFNYIVGYRSNKVSVKAGSAYNDGGIILKP